MSDFIGVTEVVTEDVFNSSCYAFPGALFKTIWLYCEMCLIQKNHILKLGFSSCRVIDYLNDHTSETIRLRNTFNK